MNNKGADQTVDALLLFTYGISGFSHDMAHLVYVGNFLHAKFKRKELNKGQIVLPENNKMYSNINLYQR